MYKQTIDAKELGRQQSLLEFIAFSYSLLLDKGLGLRILQGITRYP